MIGKWDAFVQAHPKGSVLQSWNMYSIFKDTKCFEPLVVFCTEENDLVGLVSGVIIKEGKGIKGMFSSRLVVYGGPLITPLHPEKSKICDLLLGQLVSVTSNKAIFSQFRAAFDMREFSECFLKYDFKWYPRLNLLIDTSNPEGVFRNLSGSRKRQIKKSIQNGAEIIEAQSAGQVHEFYLILRDLYRLKVKKPLPDFSFFNAFFYNAVKQNLGKILLVQYEGKIIGGILCPFMSGKSMFEWYVCGLDRDYNEKGIYPSVLATWAAIDYATRNNISLFDFMGLGKPDVDYGVRDFKLRFGGSVVNHGRMIRINMPLTYWISELGFNLLSAIRKI